MEELSFYKYSGHGNDFIIIDNWDGNVAEVDFSKYAKLLSRPKFAIGADGVVYIMEGPQEVDFAVRFFNSDGSEADMCGNASRCAAHLAYTLNIARSDMIFRTQAGHIKAQVKDSYVSVRLPFISRPEGVSMVEVDGLSRTYYRINTGVAHAVTWVDDIEAVNVYKVGRAVRRHPNFNPAGTNVDFVHVVSDNIIEVRTYERGVEHETLACGTGCTAAALLSVYNGLAKGPSIVCKTKGGEDLTVRFEGEIDKLTSVFLEGPVRYVFSGTTGPDILKAVKKL
ncbi:MAG: diaminopimelate epimerase [Deltaproteobacteria bacterium]|jgi:diaminopimelate epimerase|nr:diaminopimelate epimerase [Deltaproteobacteria bacterium]